MKKKTRLILILSISAFIILAGFFTTFALLTSKSKKSITIGFYNTSESIQQSVEKTTRQFYNSTNTKITFYTFDSNSSLQTQLKKNKVDLIIAAGGYAVRNSVSLAESGIDSSKVDLSGLFSSMREASITDNQLIKAVPLIFDNFEIDIELSAFKMSGMKAIGNWKDIEEFVQIQKKANEYPVCFAGSDPVFLLDLLGALGEAFEGKEAYDKAAQILIQASESHDFDAAIIVNKLFINPEAPIPYSIYYLNKLYKQGYITPASQYLTHSDINSYLQQRVTNLFFTTLSLHRTYDVKAIERYSSIYIPSEFSPEQRHFTATTTYAVPVSKNADLADLLQKLISTETQTSLSRATGLAPVLSNCPTPDKQADDARYWIAATSTPLAGLGHEAEFSEEQLEQLLKAINSLLFS